MSRRSEHVKAWRKRSKNRIIEAMGGSCCCCGYDKAHGALALHHLDPKEKDFGLSSIRASPKNWDIVVEELRKCVLVCNNCHAEIHEGLITIPENSPRFNEKFADYKKLKQYNKNILTPCLMCEKMKASYLMYCSHACAAKARYKINWDDIDLVEELKTKSVVKLAEELGCSDVAIHKRMKKLGVK